MIISISALIQSWQQLCHFIIIPRHASIMDLLNGMKGNTGNINILAASLTIKIPFLLLGITHFKTYKKWFLVFILFSVTSVVFLTGARTPFINLFLIYLIYIIYLLKEYSFKRALISKVLFLIIPILAAILFANSIFEKSKDKGRFTSLENRVSKINNDESSKLRLAFWGNALKITKKAPLTGIGLGNYQVESIPYERTTSNDSMVSLHTHNDFLEILAETGIINGFIYLSIFICLFFINLKKIIKPKDKESQIIALLTLLLLIVYGIDSFFNFPMYRPTMAIFFSFILALSLTNSEINQFALPNKIFSLKIITPIIIVVSILTSYSAFVIYKSSNLEYLIARDDINVNLKGFLTGDEVVKKMPAYPNTLSSSESFYEYAGIYYVREKQYDKALKCFSKANKINGYSGRIEFYKHVISKHKGNIDSAYVYAKQAFYLRPRNYDIFNTALKYAISKRDTTEIVKQHNLFSQYRPMPQTWDLAVRGLKYSGYNDQNLLKFIDQGLKKFPQDSALTVQRNQLLITSYLTGGQNFENKSDLNNALQSYEKALKIDPKNVYISQNIGFNYLKQGQNKKAINALLEALKYPGLKDGKTEFFLGIAYLRENDKTNALKYFNLSKDKNYPAAKQLMSKMQNAEADETALKKRKNDLLIADIITEGQNFEKQKEMDKALDSYQKALKIDPKSIYAAQNIGFYYLKVGQSKKAINYLLNALKYPGLNDGKTEYFLAICYLKEDDKTNACKYINISKNKNYSDAQQLLKTCK